MHKYICICVHIYLDMTDTATLECSWNRCPGGLTEIIWSFRGAAFELVACGAAYGIAYRGERSHLYVHFVILAKPSDDMLGVGHLATSLFHCDSLGKESCHHGSHCREAWKMLWEPWQSWPWQEGAMEKRHGAHGKKAMNTLKGIRWILSGPLSAS